MSSIGTMKVNTDGSRPTQGNPLMGGSNGLFYHPLSENSEAMAYLADIGFSGLSSGSYFHSVDIGRMRKNAEIVAEMVGIVLQELKAHINMVTMGMAAGPTSAPADMTQQ
jgi:hypothetical protein